MNRYILILVLSLVPLLWMCNSKGPENDTRIEVNNLSIEPDNLSLYEGETFQLTVIVSPSDATDVNVLWECDNPSVAIVDKTGKIGALKTGGAIVSAKVGSVVAKCTVSVKKTVPNGAEDIGLSVYWGKSNLGASKPEEYGNYYSWGEITTKDVYLDYSYKWFKDGDRNKILKYCPSDKTKYWGGDGSPDNKVVLEKEDDAATVLLGDRWRLPTKEEFLELIATKELKKEYGWTWESRNGHYGWSVKYLINGNTVFFPAGGHLGKKYSETIGSYGLYWSSSVDLTYPDAAGLFTFRSVDFYWGENTMREHGLTIRPVSDIF